jgi:hypothetical protein
MATGILAAIDGLVTLFVLLDLTDLLLIHAGKWPLPGWRRIRADHLIARDGHGLMIRRPSRLLSRACSPGLLDGG